METVRDNGWYVANIRFMHVAMHLQRLCTPLFAYCSRIIKVKDFKINHGD